jgi:hypothetical protein
MAICLIACAVAGGMRSIANVSVRPTPAVRDAAPGESNWFNFWTTAPTNANGLFIRAVAGGVVSEARERYNVLDS